jgi:hypothetical protein
MAQFGRLGKPDVKCHIDDMANIPAPPPARPATSTASDAPSATQPPAGTPQPREIGGPKGPEPTRYGDWEVNGRCSDF